MIPEEFLEPTDRPLHFEDKDPHWFRIEQPDRPGPYAIGMNIGCVAPAVVHIQVWDSGKVVAEQHWELEPGPMETIKIPVPPAKRGFWYVRVREINPIGWS